MQRKWEIIYTLTMAILAIITCLLIIFDFTREINIMDYPYNVVDNTILVIFTIDYFTRLILAKDKKKFFIHNIFDLLSIIPVSQISWAFRISRVSRLLRLLRLFRLVGLTGRFRKFLQSDGLIYYLYVTWAVLFLSAGMYSISENKRFATGLWWAISTASTVGYGDVAPTTTIAKLAAVILMIVGIGLIGVLTSAVTNYFSSDNKDHVNDKLDQLQQENQALAKQLKEISQQLTALKQEQSDKN